MKRYSRILGLLIAIFVLFGSISFSGFAFADDENWQQEEVLEVLEQEDDKEEEDLPDLDENQNDHEGDDLPSVDEDEVDDEDEESLDEEDELDLEEDFESQNMNFQLQTKPVNTGSVKIHKRIKELDKRIHADFGKESFTIRLTGPDGYDEELVINKGNSGDHVTFTDLAPGLYQIDEIDLDTDIYSGFYVAEPGNHGSEVGYEVEVTSKGKNHNVNVWLINEVKKKEEPEKPKYGSVEVTKRISTNDPSSDDLSGFFFELHQDGDLKYGPFETDEDGKVLFNKVELGKYDVVEVLTDEQKDKFIEPENETVDVNEEGVKFQVLFTNHFKPEEPIWNKGKIVVTKLKWGLPQGRLGIRLPEDPRDILFTLEGDNIDGIMKVKTNRLGIATFDNLPEGTYTLNEIVPEGYRSSLPDEGKEIEIKKDKLFGIVTILVNNYKLPPEQEWEGTIEVQKLVVDEATDELLDEKSGFKFELYEIIGDENALYDDGFTDEDGILQFKNLSEGIYLLKEVDKEGYRSSLPDEGLTIELFRDNEDLTEDNKFVVEVTNTKLQWKGKIRVVKTLETPQPNNSSLDGFEFELWKGDEQIGEPKKTLAGIVEFNNLVEGEYQVREVNHEGYIPHFPNGATIEIGPDNDNDDVFVVVVLNRLDAETPGWTGTILVEKKVTDPLNNNPSLAGFTFHLYKVEGDGEVLVETITTGTSGLISFSELEEGEYKLYEDSRAFFVRGISSAGITIVLNEETAPDRVILSIVVNERFYPDDDDDTPPGGGGTTTPDDDDDDDEVEVLDVEDIEEDVPQSPPPFNPPIPPQPTIPPQVMPEEVEEVEEETPQAAPIAALPKTGTANPFMYSGLGTILLGLGIYFKKKKD